MELAKVAQKGYFYQTAFCNYIIIMSALCNFDKTLQHLDANCTGAEFSISKMQNNHKLYFLDLTPVARLS
jgi:hypothetical protein